MIVSPFSKPSPEEAAEAVRDFVNNHRKKFIGLADLFYDGYYFPRNSSSAILLYREAIDANAEMMPQKRLIVLQRIIDFYLQRSAYSEARRYQRMMEPEQLFAFALLYYNNNMQDSAVPCFEEYLHFESAGHDEIIQCRTILVRYYIEKQSFTNAATYICDFKNDAGNVIGDVLAQLTPENKQILANYFYLHLKYPQAIDCLSSLCKDGEVREIDSAYKLETMLLDSYCHCRIFDAAAEVFQMIPPRFLTEEAIYQGIAAMRAGGEKYSQQLINVCYTVCMQKPVVEKTPLYAGLLEENCLVAEDYSSAYYWANRTGDNRNLDNLKDKAHKFKVSRSYAAAFALIAYLLLLFLPLSLRIPPIKSVRGCGLAAYISSICFLVIFLWHSCSNVKEFRSHCEDKTNDKSSLAIAAMLLVGCGILVNGNIGSPTAGRILCATEMLLGTGVVLYLLLKQKYPFTHLHLIMPIKKIILLLVSMALGIAVGLALSAVSTHGELIWCGLFAFWLFFRGLDFIFHHKPEKG